MEVRRLNPADDETFDAWHAVYWAAERFGREHANAWALEEFRADRTSDSPHRTFAMLTGWVDGQCVAAGDVEMSLVDRADEAQVYCFVHPDHRRRGHGSQLLAALEGIAQEHGRTVLTAEAAYPYDGPADGAGSAGPEFASRHGYSFGLGDVMRVLDLPTDPARLERLLAEAASHHPSYTIRTWIGPVPDDIVAGWVELNALVATEAPTGDLEVAPHAADVAVHRAREAVSAAQRRTNFHATALDADGRPVAYNELVLPELDPGRVYQWGTLVRREHRGHRLGMAVKAANLLQLQQAHPEPLLLATYNAEVNSHMIGINEQLGFRPVERLGEFQKRLGRS